MALGYRKKADKFHDLGDGRMKVQDIDEKGGGVVVADLEPEHIELALRANEALGLSVIGFDMIWTNNGPMIVDENTYPGNYSDLYEQIDIDPAKYFANMILKDLK